MNPGKSADGRHLWFYGEVRVIILKPACRTAATIEESRRTEETPNTSAQPIFVFTWTESTPGRIEIARFTHSPQNGLDIPCTTRRIELFSGGLQTSPMNATENAANDVNTSIAART
jgi:hypothetical protein